MVNDLRSKIAILIFCLIPAGGVYHYVQHWRIMSNKICLHVSALSYAPEIKHVQLSGFHFVSALSTRNHSHEYIFIQSTTAAAADSKPTFVALRRQKQLSGSITSRISYGVVNGLTSDSQIDREFAERIGVPFPEAAPERVVLVEVEREYLTSIVATTVGLSIVCLPFLVYACLKFEERGSTEKLRQNAVRAQVALHIAISKAETF